MMSGLPIRVRQLGQKMIIIVTLRLVTSYYILGSVHHTTPLSGDETSVAKWGQRHTAFPAAVAACCGAAVVACCSGSMCSSRAAVCVRIIVPSPFLFYNILYYMVYVPWSVVTKAPHPPLYIYSLLFRRRDGGVKPI